MADGVQTGALARSIRALTLGTVQAHAEIRSYQEQEGLGELDLQYQIPIAGKATGLPGWTTTQVTFEWPLIIALDERQSPYRDPLFTSGFVLLTVDPVVHTVHVRRWLMHKHSDRHYVGAEIEVGVWSPASETQTPFRGEVHLNFQGYGTPGEAPTDEDGN